MIVISIMFNGIAYSGVVQNVSKLTSKLIASNQSSPYKFQSLLHGIR